MAGDWIKMRGNLWDDPRVGRISDMCETSEGPVIGALYWLWTTADQHTEDGFMPGMTLRQIDRKTGLSGFGAALCDVGWIQDGPEGITIMKFEEHNGSSAKRRCMDAQRKANSRKGSAPDPEDGNGASASDADKTRTNEGQKAPNRGAREEKRREEVIPPPTGGEAAGKPRPARKCPPGFAVTAEMRAWADEKYPGVRLDEETDAFRDHTFKAAISDWPGAWRNWIRKAKSFGPQARASPTAPNRQEAIEARNRAAVEAALAGG